MTSGCEIWVQNVLWLRGVGEKEEEKKEEEVRAERERERILV